MPNDERGRGGGGGANEPRLRDSYPLAMAIIGPLCSGYETRSMCSKQKALRTHAGVSGNKMRVPAHELLKVVSSTKRKFSREKRMTSLAR